MILLLLLLFDLIFLEGKIARVSVFGMSRECSVCAV